jgi:hypothetical protein
MYFLSDLACGARLGGTIFKAKAKVKLSHYRPGQAVGVPRG